MGRSKTRRATDEQVALGEEFEVQLGRLIINWANAETWLTNILSGMLNIDRDYGDAIVQGFQSSRARVDLVDRIGMMSLDNARTVRRLKKLLNEFRGVTKTRNWLCHGMYDIDASRSTVTAIVAMHFHSNFDGRNYTEVRPLTAATLNEVKSAQLNALRLIGRLRRFAENVSERILERPRDTPLQLQKMRKTKARRPRRGS